MHATIEETPDPESRASTLFAWIAFSAFVALVIGSQQPPLALPASAPEEVFSAARAATVLQRILGDQQPHPIGSSQNAAVRSRVIAEFERLGLQVQIRTRFVCADSGNCGTPYNLFARMPGRSDVPALLLSAHYDSVPAGPGAADDGAGVAAVLEIARALLAERSERRELFLLIDDGEEAGLLGAEAFRQEPEFSRVGAAINLEARGTSGLSNLFETHEGNAAIIAAVANELPHPALDSVAFEIYKRMPNNTDFSVFRRDGLAGLNFAFIGGGQRYHTPLDDFAHLDLRSLQQQGENALAATRALAAPEIDFRAAFDRVYFDILHRWVVTWPASWNAPLACMGLLLWTLAAVRYLRIGELSTWRLWFGLLALILTLLASSSVASLALSLWRWLGAVPMNWTANGPVLQVASAAIGGLAAVVLIGRAARRVGTSTMLVAYALLFLLIAFAAAEVIPGAAHWGLVILIPGSAACALWPLQRERAALTLGLIGVAILLPLGLALYDSMGPSALPGLAMLSSLLLAPLAALQPNLGRRTDRALMLGFGLFAVASGSIAIWLPAFNADSMRPLTLRHVEGPNTAMLHLLGVQALKDLPFATDQPATPSVMIPWSVSESLALAMPRHRDHLPVVSVKRVAGPKAGAETLVIEVSSDHPAQQIGVVIPTTVGNAQIQVNQTPLAPPIRRAAMAASNWKTLLVHLKQDEQSRPYAEFRIAWPAKTVFNGFAFALKYGVPNPAMNIARERARHAVPVQTGDASVSWRPVTSG